uniref:Uncharacterized protein n=1 Tax=Mandrillus leucophaeus TaxID=9568 RepID=A0A2K5ZKI4_MANLE
MRAVAGWGSPGRCSQLSRPRTRSSRSGGCCRSRRSEAGRRPARSARCRCGQSRGQWRWAAGKVCPPREHGRREGGRVVVDVEHDDPTLKQVYPALRGPDHRHLEVQEALVLVEDHLTLGQLLAVDAPLAGAQLAREVVDLKVLGAGLQAESHLTRSGHDAQV